MSDLADLYRAVMDNRTDDTARLVYADALEGTDRPEDAARAAFIRLSVEYDRMPKYEPVVCGVCGQSSAADGFLRHGEHCPTRPKTQVFRGDQRRAALGTSLNLAMHDADVAAWFPGPWWDGHRATAFFYEGVVYADQVYYGRQESFRFGFSRGFVSRVEMTADAWARHAPRILAEHPIESVAVLAEPAEWPPPWLGYRVRERMARVGEGPWVPDRDCYDAADRLWLGLFRMTWPGLRIEAKPAEIPRVGHVTGVDIAADGRLSYTVRATFDTMRGQQWGQIIRSVPLPAGFLNVDLDAPPPTDAPGSANTGSCL